MWQCRTVPLSIALLDVALATLMSAFVSLTYRSHEAEPSQIHNLITES